MRILPHPFHRRSKTRATQPIGHPTRVATIEGRRHRIDVPYVLPKDHQEINRLDFQHFGFKLLLGANYKAPLKLTQVKSILDVGSGTGRWMHEIALEFPYTQVEGIDIEPPASHIRLPLNCHFTQGDILRGIPYPDHVFDYTHQRLLVGGIPTYQWPFVVQELLRVTRPEGYIELLETGNVFHHMGPATQQLKGWWDAGMGRAGFDLAMMPTIDALLARLGLQNIHMETIQVPLGKWAGRAGDLLGRDIFEVFKSFKAVYVNRLGVQPALFDQLVALLPEEWEVHHTTYEFYAVFGQK